MQVNYLITGSAAGEQGAQFFMQQYNFQINNPTNWRDWGKVPVKVRYLSHWEQAVALAKRAARRYHSEIRLTEGGQPLRANGHYFRG